MPTKVEDMTIVELKAHAFDVIANIEQFQKELQMTNQAIAQKQQEEAENAKSKSKTS